MSQDLHVMFPHASADFLRKNGYANIPPPRQMPSREAKEAQNTQELPPTLPMTRPEADRAPNAVSFTLPYPPSENMYRRTIILGGKNKKVRAVPILSREARAYKEAVAKVAPRCGFDGPLSLTLAIYRPRRIGDIDNGLKALFDSMTGLVYVDDGQICRLEVERFDDKANPRVEVTVRPA
jgi:Holliday junction resolvase RusA-like endonuclease